MHVFVCSSCFYALRVLNGEHDGGNLVGPLSDVWGKFHECPACSANKMFGHPESALAPELVAKIRIRDLEPTECFTALMGGGLPEEQMANASTVKTALLGSAVRDITVRNLPGTTRCILDRIVLEDGTRIYLGAGPQGATVYRVAKREEL